jgi:hypothetical protein
MRLTVGGTVHLLVDEVLTVFNSGERSQCPRFPALGYEPDYFRKELIQFPRVRPEHVAFASRESHRFKQIH